MDGQMSIFDIPEYVPDSLKPLEEPEFDESILKGIKGISDIVPQLPKYEIELKEPDFKGRKIKTAVWVGYFHSISDSGWNYDLKDIKSYKQIEDKPKIELCPALGMDDCKYYSGYKCNRYGYEFEEKKEYYFSELIKGHACAGCCWHCDSAPHHGGKCKFDCRYKEG